MKRKLFCLSFAVCLTAVMSLNAQVSFGPKAGLNLATISGDDVEDAGLKIGGQIGGMAHMAFSDNLGLQPALMLSMKGYRYSESAGGITATTTLSLNYLEIPVNIVYGIDMGDNQFQIFAGPYFAYGLFGKYKMEMDGGDELEDMGFDMSGETDVQFVGDAKDAGAALIPINAMDFGVNAGLGFKAGAIQIQAAYGLGFGNLNPKYDGETPESTTTNSVIQLSFAYLLGN